MARKICTQPTLWIPKVSPSSTPQSLQWWAVPGQSRKHLFSNHQNLSLLISFFLWQWRTHRRVSIPGRRTSAHNDIICSARRNFHPSLDNPQDSDKTPRWRLLGTIWSAGCKWRRSHLAFRVESARIPRVLSRICRSARKR